MFRFGYSSQLSPFYNYKIYVFVYIYAMYETPVFLMTSFMNLYIYSFNVFERAFLHFFGIIQFTIYVYIFRHISTLLHLRYVWTYVYDTKISLLLYSVVIFMIVVFHLMWLLLLLLWYKSHLVSMEKTIFFCEGEWKRTPAMIVCN